MENKNVAENNLWNLGFETIRELETELGILASGKEEIFGCIFGRDSLITALKLLRVYEHTQDEYFLGLVKKILANLAALQGKNFNIESGEEPGKMIHEYRPTNHEHLTKHIEKPWYVYGDNIMRNYDSVDSTMLFLIACYRYGQLSNDEAFLKTYKDNIILGLRWILDFADTNSDGFIDYRLHPDRKSGGLKTQSWMDSSESVFHEDSTPVAFPIAPVEAQGYAFLALKLWSQYFAEYDFNFSTELEARAVTLKHSFNATFVIPDVYGLILASGIDGNGKLMASARSSMGHCLWASLEENKDGFRESILNDEFIPHIVERLMKPDLFEPKAGIRTLSSLSINFSPNSYHNGSIWPHDTSIVASGMDIFGYHEESTKIRNGVLSALEHFKTPIELFVYDNDYAEYCSPFGQRACKKQAWAAASMLRDVSTFRPTQQ
ncbi:MAG: Amylo-alpha6-glucosidase [Candidatus Paceibacter sp.]|jgi:glycogen debranching enzyme|nr:Amylo-alpha6-glucosidase [Candidatus Paceibacter sp.]